MHLQRVLEQDHVMLDEKFYNDIQRYKEHLQRWNSVHNLTGARRESMVDTFIYDALFPLSFLPKVDSLMDVGTGAGFPGLMLAMALPKTQVTLVEPLSKRASFLQFIKADLKLSNVRVKNCRVEAFQSEGFDLITSRAVTDTNVLLALSRAHITNETLVLLYKGEQVFNEVDEHLNYEIIQRQKRHYLLLRDIGREAC